MKGEALSLFEERKRNRTNNYDELSVVSATKRPKELKGHNNFETSSHWNTQKHQREWKRPTDIYVPENSGFPVSPLIYLWQEQERHWSTTTMLVHGLHFYVQAA